MSVASPRASPIGPRGSFSDGTNFELQDLNIAEASAYPRVGTEHASAVIVNGSSLPPVDRGFGAWSFVGSRCWPDLAN